MVYVGGVHFVRACVGQKPVEVGFLYHVSSKNGTQVVSLGSKHPFPAEPSHTDRTSNSQLVIICRAAL